MVALKIPMVDLKDLYNKPFDQNDKQIREIAEAFGQALHTVGFVYLKNHGIPEDMIVKAFAESLNFFELPQDVKSKYVKKDVVKNYHGYVEQGQELLNEGSVHEVREAFDVFKLNRYYPEEIPEFRVALESLEKACRSLDVKLMRMLAMAVKLNDLEFFNKAAANLQDTGVESLNTLRTLYYPPLFKQVKSGAVRCAEHTDYGIVTLLFQDFIGGLEVKTIDNKWIQAEPIPGTIVVNTGDLLDCWTGGYFRATPHRVLIPEDEKQRQSMRQSIAFFLQPDDQVMITPLKSEVLTTQYDFEPISSFDHAMNKVKKSYTGY